MTKQNAVIIINPTAGRGQAGKSSGAIRDLLSSEHWDWQWQYTQAAGDAERMAREAAAKGVPLIVAVGGDGTLHEVTNGLLGSQSTLGLIPFGTGNDFARAIGIYGNLERACKAVTDGETRYIDVGMIEGNGTNGPRHFLVIAGTGFVAETAKTVNSGVKYLAGAPAYVWGAILTLIKFTPFQLTLAIGEDTPRKKSAMFVAVANTPMTGGGMKICPGAVVDDGIFDICEVAAVPKGVLMYELSRVFSGDHVKNPAVTILRGTTIQIDADPPQPLLIDGEVLGTTPAKITILKNALPLKVPTQ